MLLLLDENSSGRNFRRQLEARGHDVLISSDVLHFGATDSEVFESATDLGRIVVTRDCDDYRALAGQTLLHPGLLFIYSTKISDSRLALAVSRIEEIVPELTGSILSIDEFAW